MKAIIKPLYEKVKCITTIHYDTIAKILRGDRRPSPELAKKLEQVTGVSRLAWLYPDEFYNPYIKPKSNKQQNKQKKT